MTVLHLIAGVGVCALSLAAGVLGAWLWRRGGSGQLFWRLLRTAQLALLTEILLGTVQLARGERPDSKLHYLYGLLPLAVSFIAEQLRVSAAAVILSEHGMASAQEVGKLPEADQHRLVREIVSRELGVMTLAAFAIFGLAVRAATT